ncbi:MAG: phage Gp37/Gp68 family protein [Muribaculaceae bacterium]|nr:phage Gp37/Gp68 family protein [Muribaculaceae bacterium]
MLIWNPWHGCHKISEGCDHCYMYFLDSKRGVDTSIVTKTANFDLPIRQDRKGNFKLRSGMQIYVCLSTDFFVKEADAWRPEIWKMIRQRSDIAFRILTKRAHRIKECLPDDWGEGYPNVMLSVTCENQKRTDERLPILLSISARHKGFMAAPFIGAIDAGKYLAGGQIEEVLCGGENYDGARVCRFEWVESLSKQCIENEVTFNFIETGTVFEKDGKTYRIPSKRVQSTQAYKSGLSKSFGKPKFDLKSPSGSLFELESYTPFFREHCNTCGSRLTCNGCSNCGNCNSSINMT